ncbi:MAG: SpoIIE family protein phosphatase [Spirochaetes bacterium]|nr:SpoIIE family protein phosphatase [Spirochaetota bacterium]
MVWLYNIYFLSNIIAFTVMAVVIYFAFKNRAIIGAKAFIALALLLETGILVDAMAMISAGEEMALFWYSLRFIALAGVPPVWLVFTLHYTGRSHRLTPVRYAMLFAIPVLTQIILWTNGIHGLWVIHDVDFLRAGPFMIANVGARVQGPWFMVHSVFGYCCLLFGITLIFQWSYHMSRLYRSQAMALWLGMIIMTAGSAIPTFNLIPGLIVNPIILGLAVSALFFAWAIFRHRFLDMVPIARDRLIDSMEDCMFVIDRMNRIVDINEPMQRLVAEAFLEIHSEVPELLIGQPITSLILPWRDLAMQFKDTMDIKTEIVLALGGTDHYYDLKISPVMDKVGQQIGRIIVLRDVTGHRLIEDERRLSEARLDALYKLSQTDFPTEKQTVDYALEEAVRLTGSEIGYFHLVSEDKVSLELFTWSRKVMKNCTASKDRHYPLSMAGVWADCARTMRPVVHNDYQNLPGRKGYPEGHSHIVRHMSVPVVRNGRVEAISGVANKGELYNDTDIRQLQLFMDGLWKIIERKRGQEELAQAFKEKEKLLADLQISEKLLRERNEKMEEDLRLAQATQKGIMNSDKPGSDRINVDYRYKPLEMVGGDYFSFFTSRDDVMGLFIGDVTGHGIAAALFTALLKSATSRVFRDYGDTPALFMKNLNRELLDYMTSYFVTGIYCVCSPCGGMEYVDFKFSVGAHPFPIIRSGNGDFSYSGVSNDIIGLTDDVSYTDTVVRLNPGDRIYFYTDGMPETKNSMGEPIGFGDGLIDLFRKADRPALSDTLDAVFDVLAGYRESNPLRDDITVIGIEVNKPALADDDAGACSE